MKKIIILIILIITGFIINIPSYTELNNLAIIEEISIEKTTNNYIIILKEVIPIKNEQGINKKYKYYKETNKSLDKAINNINKKTSKKIYLSKTKTLITNVTNTDKLKKELGIKPNSIIHKPNNLEKIIKS